MTGHINKCLTTHVFSAIIEALVKVVRGCSSVGRALRSQRRGQGFESLHLHHVGTDFAPFRFFLQKNKPNAPSFLLFRKKARSAQLLPCKRVRDVSLSLPPFCAMRLRREYLFGSFFLTRFLHDLIQYLYSAILFSLTAEIGMIEYENWDLHIPVKSCIINLGRKIQHRKGDF